jgi:hypothetical protein
MLVSLAGSLALQNSRVGPGGGLSARARYDRD